MIISILNQKGGVGKTTLTIHLASAFVHMGYKVLVVDADPQGSSLDWSASRTNDPLFPVIGLPKTNLHKAIQDHVPIYDIILIDGPPRVNELARSAIMAADIVLIPVQPSPYDVWAAKEIIELLKEASVFKEKQKYAFVVNRKIVNTAIGRDVLEALQGYETPVLEITLSQRVAFAESATQGKTVLETHPKSIASEEVMNLAKEVLKFSGELAHV
jgi:chromosome partitioning protein